MKKRKLLILLAAVLSFSLLLASCNGTTDGEGTESTTSAPVNDGIAQEAVGHEIRDYFVLEGDIETVSYAEVSRIDGEIVDRDRENNLLAVKTKDLDVENRVIETVKVYDLSTGDVINEQSVTYDLYAAPKDITVLTVDIDYPVIRVTRETTDAEGVMTCSASYYFAKKGSENIRSADNDTYEMRRFENGLVACNMGGDVVWIDKDMEIVRTVAAVIANGYEIDAFNAEYEGYVYAWNECSIQIFNRAGMCCAAYEVPDEDYLNIHVLDDGNVLIQKIAIVDEYTACDFLWSGFRYKMTSYVMSFVDGTVREIALDFMVTELETAYGDGDALPFALAEGRDNRALIHRFANEGLAIYPEYVVLSNALEVEYTLKNTTPGVILQDAYALNANYYVANVNAGGCIRPYIFDLDGNMISAYADGSVNSKFIVTENAIYDYSMNVVLDIESSDFNGNTVTVDGMSDNVYLSKPNFYTAKEEWYLFDGSTKAPTLLADGDDARFEGTFGGIYATESDGVHTICAADGTVLLVTYGAIDVDTFDKMTVISTTFEGAPITYILK